MYSLLNRELYPTLPIRKQEKLLTGTMNIRRDSILKPKGTAHLDCSAVMWFVNYQRLSDR